ncbi:MAG: choice-of-anchor L domain-containing protein [Flavobacteriales bacterium]|nr:choice-of-anchor L domain-containing protein [Flavobacteriales bacterium]
MKARPFLLTLLSALSFSGFGQLIVDQSMTPQQLVQNVLLGSGVAVSNITFNGTPGTTVSVQAARFDGTNCNVGMTSGLLLASGNTNLAIGPNNAGGTTQPPGGLGLGGDPDLTQLLGGTFQTHDAAVLEFDFIPNGDTLTFRYVFGSEEYLEWVGSSFNDVFGFFISGPGFMGPYSNNAVNIALIPSTTTPVSINNVNATSNSAYYVDNGDGWSPPQNTDSTVLQFDGFTVVLEARAIVQCGQQYHIKLAVADAGDHILDSGVFLEGGSFSSTAAVTASLSTVVGLQDSTLYEGCASAILSFRRYGDFSVADTVDLIVGGTATNGVDYVPALPNNIIFQPGDSIVYIVLSAPLDPDGLETVDLEMQNVAACSGMLVVTNFTFYISEAQPMYITTFDAAIGCDDVITLGPTVYEGYGNYGYLWNTGATTATITVSPPITTTYTVTVTDTCFMVPQTGSFTITVPVYPPVSITVSPDVSIPCLATTTLSVTSVTGGDGVYTYTWTDAAGNVLGNASSLTVSSGPTATYYVEVEAGCGMNAYGQVTVSPMPLPPIQVQTNNDTTVLCPGDPVDLLVASAIGGNGVYTYTWTDAAGNVIATTSTTTVAVNAIATYQVLVEDQCGYSGTDDITVQPPVWEPYVLAVVNDTAICLGTQGQLWAQASGGAGGYTYYWPTLASNDSVLTLTPGAPATYPVTVTDQCGYVLMGSMFMDVQYVTAGFYINYGDEFEVTFYDASSSNVTQWSWNFDDGNFASTPYVYHRFLDVDDHDVWLTVWNPIGCVDSTNMLVQPPAHIYVPNSFTPNGDGNNDFFGPIGHDIFKLEMRIFDRWGELIFETTDIDKPWDGRVNGGEVAKTDVYVYTLKASGRRFGPVTYTGHVSLIK